MPSPLRVYLRDHEAAAHGGLALFRRAAHGQQHRPWAGELAQLSDDVGADLDRLRRLMRHLGVAPDRGLETVMLLGELLGRVKPNGRLFRRAPLSDLVEVEAMLDAVHAKQQGWIALLAAGGHPPAETSELSELCHRAEKQQQKLQRIHRTAAAAVLGGQADTPDILDDERG